MPVVYRTLNVLPKIGLSTSDKFIHIILNMSQWYILSCTSLQMRGKSVQHVYSHTALR